MCENDVITGKDGLLAPLDPARRCKVATMLQRFVPILRSAS